MKPKRVTSDMLFTNYVVRCANASPAQLMRAGMKQAQIFKIFRVMVLQFRAPETFGPKEDALCPVGQIRLSSSSKSVTSRFISADPHLPNVTSQVP